MHGCVVSSVEVKEQCRALRVFKSRLATNLLVVEWSLGKGLGGVTFAPFLVAMLGKLNGSGDVLKSSDGMMCQVS
jgi:hypothetical protein